MLAVQDQLEIQQLYARYNHALDFGNAAGWAGLFTADGTFNSGQGAFTGTEQLTAFATGFSSRMKARHWTNNLVVDGDGNAATGTCYLLLYNVADPAKPAILANAIYRDKLAKTGDGWRFTERVVTPE